MIVNVKILANILKKISLKCKYGFPFLESYNF